MVRMDSGLAEACECEHLTAEALQECSRAVPVMQEEAAGVFPSRRVTDAAFRWWRSSRWCREPTMSWSRALLMF